MLIRLRMDISGHGSSTSAISLAVTKKLQPGLDVRVGGIQLGRSLIGIQSIIDLVVAALILERKSTVCTMQVEGIVATHKSPEVIPDLRNEGVQANGPAVSIQGIPVLVDLIVQHSDGAPEGGVTPIPVDSLLICFICLWIFLLRHVASAKQIPALRVAVVFARCQHIWTARKARMMDGLPAATDFSRNSMAFSWLAKLLLCW